MAHMLCSEREESLIWASGTVFSPCVVPTTLVKRKSLKTASFIVELYRKSHKSSQASRVSVCLLVWMLNTSRPSSSVLEGERIAESGETNAKVEATDADADMGLERRFGVKITQQPQGSECEHQISP